MMKPEVYKDRAGRWRWRLKSKNGRVIADSGQGYASEAATRAAWWRIEWASRTGQVREVVRRHCR